MPTKRKPQRRKLPTKFIPDPEYTAKFGPPEEGMPWGWNVRERYSRVPGTGSFDIVTCSGHEYLRARIWIENGKGVRVRKSVYGTTQIPLARSIAALKVEPSQRGVKQLTIEQYLTDRLLPGVKLRVRESTYRGYEQARRSHIVPHLGQAKLAKLRRQQRERLAE
jgi:hypothetical protein